MDGKDLQGIDNSEFDDESEQHPVDRLEMIEGVRRGLEDMKAGRTTPASKVYARMRKEFGIPD